jgi:hypothetical protein
MKVEAVLPPKRRYLPSNPDGITNRKSNIESSAAMRNSNNTKVKLSLALSIVNITRVCFQLLKRSDVHS